MKKSSTVTIRFTDGRNQTLKADSAEVKGGVLILYTYRKDRRKLQSSSSFPVEMIESAQLSNGTVVYGDPTLRFMD
jgi:hypothetical protein